jgi:hypothetical protein
MVSNPDIDNFIKEFTEKGLKENPLDVLVKIFVSDEDLRLIRRDFKRNLLEKLVKKWKNLTDSTEKSSERATEVFEKLNVLIENVKQKNKEISELETKNKTSETVVKNEAKQQTNESSFSSEINFLGKYQNAFTDILSKVKEAYEKKNSKISENKNDEFNVFSFLKNFSSEIKEFFKNKQDNTENVLSNLATILSSKEDNFLNVVNALKQEKSSVVKNYEDNNSNEENLEQKLFEKPEEETIITFSSKTNEFLTNLVDKILEKEGTGTISVQDEDNSLFGGLLGGLLGGGAVGLIPKLFGAGLAAVGGLGAIASFYWPEIKDFISEKFGNKAAETFDKFQGVINGLSKFFTLTGLQSVFGASFKSIGTLFGSISQRLADFATEMFKGTIDNILGETVEQGGKVAGSTIGSGLKGLLAKSGSLLFKGISLTALKAIPLIGTVISFGQAYARFREGEYMQGLIDIAAGLAGLVPGVGTVMSIGLSALNAFIDFKPDDEKEKFTQQSINISSALLKGVGMFSKVFGKGILKRLPLIGSLLSFGSAWDKFQQNNILGGTLDVVSGIAALVPGVGLPLSIGIDILSSFIGTDEAKETGVQKTGFDIFKIATKAISYFAKFGKPFLKRLPFIGTLLSFGSAWENFQNNNIMGGALDIVSGIATLFPGVGTVISIGIDILNSFMSAKGEDGKTGFQKVGDWFGKIVDWVKNTKVFKWITNLVGGIKDIISGSVKRGLSFLSKVPVIGGMFSYLNGLMGEETDSNIQSESEQKGPTMSDVTKKVLKSLPTKYDQEQHNSLIKNNESVEDKKQNIDSQIKNLKESKPTDEANAVTLNNKIKQLELEKQKLLEHQQNLNYQIKRYDELKDGKNLTTAEDYGLTPESELNDKINSIKEKINKISKSRDRNKGSKLNILKRELQSLENQQIDKANFYSNDDILSDLLMDQPLSSNSKSSFFERRFDSKDGKMILDLRGGNAVQLSSDDKIFASKKGDGVDKTFINLTNSIESLSKKMESLLLSKEMDSFNQKAYGPEDSSSNTPFVINNNTSTNAPEKLKITGARDEIFMMRTEFLRNNSYGRI